MVRRIVLALEFNLNVFFLSDFLLWLTHKYT